MTVRPPRPFHVPITPRPPSLLAGIILIGPSAGSGVPLRGGTRVRGMGLRANPRKAPNPRDRDREEDYGNTKARSLPLPDAALWEHSPCRQRSSTGHPLQASVCLTNSNCWRLSRLIHPPLGLHDTVKGRGRHDYRAHQPTSSPSSFMSIH